MPIPSSKVTLLIGLALVLAAAPAQAENAPPEPEPAASASTEGPTQSAGSETNSDSNNELAAAPSEETATPEREPTIFDAELPFEPRHISPPGGCDVENGCVCTLGIDRVDHGDLDLDPEDGQITVPGPGNREPVGYVVICANF